MKEQDSLCIKICWITPGTFSSFPFLSSIERRYLAFAVQFTPQYGDSFIEHLRIEILDLINNLKEGETVTDLIGTFFLFLLVYLKENLLTKRQSKNLSSCVLMQNQLMVFVGLIAELDFWTLVEDALIMLKTNC